MRINDLLKRLPRVEQIYIINTKSNEYKCLYLGNAYQTPEKLKGLSVNIIYTDFATDEKAEYTDENNTMLFIETEV